MNQKKNFWSLEILVFNSVSLKIFIRSAENSVTKFEKKKKNLSTLLINQSNNYIRILKNFNVSLIELTTVLQQLCRNQQTKNLFFKIKSRRQLTRHHYLHFINTQAKINYPPPTSPLHMIRIYKIQEFSLTIIHCLIFQNFSSYQSVIALV